MRIPADPGFRSVWLQNMVGRELMTHVRQRTRDELPPDLSAEAREAALRAVDEALYSLTMLVDGIFAPTRDETGRIQFQVDLVGRLQDVETGEVLHAESLHDGDGACGWMAGWLEGDFGEYS